MEQPIVVHCSAGEFTRLLKVRMDDTTFFEPVGEVVVVNTGCGLTSSGIVPTVRLVVFSSERAGYDCYYSRDTQTLVLREIPLPEIRPEPTYTGHLLGYRAKNIRIDQDVFCLLGDPIDPNWGGGWVLNPFFTVSCKIEGIQENPLEYHLQCRFGRQNIKVVVRKDTGVILGFRLVS